MDEVLNTPRREDQREVWPGRGTGSTALAAPEVLAVAQPTTQNRDQVPPVIGRDAFGRRDDRLRYRRLRADEGEPRSDEERADDIQLRRRRIWSYGWLRTQIRDDGLDIAVAQMTKGLRGHDDQGTAALMDAFPDGADDLAIRPVLDLTGGREGRGVESSDRWAAAREILSDQGGLPGRRMTERAKHTKSCAPRHLVRGTGNLYVRHCRPVGWEGDPVETDQCDANH